MKAVPNGGFGFAAWTENGANVSTSANYSFTVSNNRVLVANFQPATFSSWTAANFTQAQLSQPSVSGALAKPAGDGIPNLLKYACDLNPNSLDPSALPQVAMVNGQLALTYVRNKTASDLSYVVEVSSDGLNWYSGASFTVVQADDGFTQTIQVNDLTPASSSNRRFMRLRVKLN